MNKKSITILVVCLIVTVLSVSLAYYTTRIIGDGKNVSVNAKELTINFDNNNEIASGIIEPGWSSANTFSITNKSKTNFTYDIVLKNYKNTTKTNGYLVYKITSTNGYNMTEYKDMPKDGENTYDLVIARGITIEPGSSNKQSYTLEIKYLDSTEDQSIDMGSTVTGSLYIVESTTNENNPYTKGTLGYQIMEDNTNIKTRTDFSTTYTDTNIGTMYKAKEDNTDVYYFAGDARNNWVKFGTYENTKKIYVGYRADQVTREYETLEECQNDEQYSNCVEKTLWNKGDTMYWRIIRTNSDKSIRLLYHGNNVFSENAWITDTKFNANDNNSLYVGYMYGTSGSLENNRNNENSSLIKTVLENWYEINLNNYHKYISSNSIYCNDRNLSSDAQYTANSATDFYYIAYERISINFKPTYDCTETADAFSADNTSAKLTYPIGLMTADELVYAGGNYGKNNANIYYSYNAKKTLSVSNIWFTMTPIGWFNLYSGVYQSASLFFVCDNLEGYSCYGNISASSWPNQELAVRPVISIKENAIYKSGDGSASNPYEIVTE